MVRARRAIGRGLLSAGVSLVLVVVALGALSQTPGGTDIGPRAADALSKMSIGPLGLSWLIISGAFYFLGLRWRALMPPPHHPPGLGLSAIICAGLLLNYAVPGPFGELGAAWFAHRRYRVPLSDALASGVAARLLGLSTAALMSLVVWAVVELPPPSAEAEVLRTVHRLIPLAALGIGTGGGVLFWLAARPRWWRQVSSRTLGCWSGPGRLATLSRRVDGAVGALSEALARVASRGRTPYARAIGWSIMAHLSVIVGILVACGGLGVQANLAGLTFTYTATTAAAVLLFAAPGSQVGWDVMFFSLLVAAAGLPTTAAGAVAILVRLQQLSMMVVGAGVLVWLLQQTPPEPTDP